MKKYLATITAFTLTTLLLVAVHGCKKSGSGSGGKSGSIDSAEKTSFNEVAAELDTGGSLYVYLSTEQLLAGLSKNIGAWRSIVESIPDSDDAENAGKVFDLATNLVFASGIEDISGFGMSSIATEPGFYRTKVFLHHYKGQGDGFLWKVGGESAHKLTSLDLLPVNTAFATFSDLDAGLLWSVIQKQVNQSGFPEAQEFLAELPEEFQRATGLNWDKVISSLGGEYGFIITLDDSQMVPIPIPVNPPLQIPAPALALVLKVKDETIFNRVDQALKETGQQVVTVDKSDLKMRTVPVPLPLPIQLRPTLAASGGYLIIASTDALVQEILAVKGGKDGLKSTEEFKRISKGIPTEGNQFTFLSQRFGQTILEIQRTALEAAANNSSGEEPPLRLLQSLFTSGPAAFSYSVSANTDRGWITTGNGNQHPTKMIAAAAMFPVGMLAGIAVPNFIKARTTSQKHACINNLRMIDGAKAQWALEKDKTSSATPTKADVTSYLNDRFPACPEGGTYTIGKVSDQPECSIPGHALP
jgi:hypothetical protein